MRHFVSSDGRFAATLTDKALADIARFFSAAGDDETGGFLIGRYSTEHDVAIVERATGPPHDSTASRTAFRRGVRGLRQMLARIWSKGQYHLGEWHRHPGAKPSPSGRDLAQMLAFAKNEAYACPEPVLVVVAGSPSDPALSVCVVERDGGITALGTPRLPVG